MDTSANGFAVPSEVEDIVLAVSSRCPVLITGGPDEALDVARMIALQSGWGNRVHVCDFVQGDAPGSSAVLAAPPNARVVLLREVQTLTRPQQRWLLDVLDNTQRRSGAPRIIASSSVSLYQQMNRGLFDARLFYRLNALHLVVSDPKVM